MADGRHARSERSRTAVVDAYLDLVRRGDSRPTSQDVADLAGVTQRTLFNQFPDMASLVAAAAHRQTEWVAAHLPPPDSTPEGYLAGLAPVLEEMMHVRWAVLTGGGTGAPPAIPSAFAAIRRLTRERLAEVFHAHDDPDLLDALELETDPLTWRLRRLQQGRSRADAARAMTRAVLALTPIREAI
jgi:AcrR family transcriptional regulator